MAARPELPTAHCADRPPFPITLARLGHGQSLVNDSPAERFGAWLATMDVPIASVEEDTVYRCIGVQARVDPNTRTWSFRYFLNPRQPNQIEVVSEMEAMVRPGDYPSLAVETSLCDELIAGFFTIARAFMSWAFLFEVEA